MMSLNQITEIDEIDEWEFLMCNIRAKSSGLPFNIWVGPPTGPQHGPRIKVQMDHREKFDHQHLAVVSLDGRVLVGQLNTADLVLVRRYIQLNKAALFDNWQEKTDCIELAHSLKRLGRA